MAISDKLVALEASDELQRYEPPTRQPAQRRLYLAAPAQRDLTDPHSAVNALTGRGFIHAALTRWTSGGLVYGDTKGRFLCRLSPPPQEIWEIRVSAVDQARLFGRFAEPDTLILTKFHTRRKLGSRGSSAWVAAMRECEQTWQDLFDSPPFQRADDSRLCNSGELR